MRTAFCQISCETDEQEDKYCPSCGSENPEEFYCSIQTDECVGCSECIDIVAWRDFF